jgi:hypothetical protein
MASSMNGAGGSGNNTDEIRYRSYLTQMERQQDAEIKEKDENHKDQVARIVSGHDNQQKNLRTDYNVKISEEADAMEKKLETIRQRNLAITTQEKESGEAEAEKIHHQYAAKIEQEKKTGDEQIAKLQSHYKKSSEDLAKQHQRAREKAELKT